MYLMIESDITGCLESDHVKNCPVEVGGNEKDPYTHTNACIAKEYHSRPWVAWEISAARCLSDKTTLPLWQSVLRKNTTVDRK